jgi:hypothetical protein
VAIFPKLINNEEQFIKTKYFRMVLTVENVRTAEELFAIYYAVLLHCGD